MNKQALAEHAAIRFLITFLLAVIGGIVFNVLHLPIPWMLGSMIFVFIGSKLFQSVKPLWPGYIRNTGMIIVGYTFGLSFTLSTLVQIKRQLPTMILMTLLLLLFCAIIAYLIAKATGIPYATVLTGSIPGGLSQIISLAEETKGIDLTIVTFLQISRLMMIVICIPILIFSPLFGIGEAHSVLPGNVAAPALTHGEPLFPILLVFAVLCTVCAVISERIKLPTPYLLAPLLVTALLHLSGVSAPELPVSWINASQLMIGSYVGLLLKPESLKNKFKMFFVAMISGLSLISGSFGLSILLRKLHGDSPATSLLSLAPGGMDQMGIIAHEVNGDISIVTSYQLFRILFILLLIPPLLKMLFRFMERTRGRG
ncbi:AbrB family transcriptional regulator [Paenibacillus paridis]|uniref:AbrB family transcriptional regulator n=1 Tax=Paenibacillus paridis TaxID=2583376 RepID=UPI00111F0C7A|nr:AbrB family transcriptional regulator [Paenibacillus paridis]